MNLNGRPANYDEPDERETLLTPQVENQNVVIQEAFRKTLGNLYQRNIPLQALIALASCSDFPENEQLNSDSLKLKKYFGDAETAYRFSNMDALVKVLEYSSEAFEEIIANSQKQKLQAIKIKSRKKLAEFESRNTNKLNELLQRLESLRSDVKNEFKTTISRLKRELDATVDSQFSGVLSACYNFIGASDDSEIVKTNVINTVRALPYRIDTAINEKVDKAVDDLRNYLVKRFSEFKDVDIAVPDIDFNLYISTDVDIESVVENLDITFGDVLDVAGLAIAGAGIGSLFPGFGTIIGAGIGAGVGLIAKVAYGDGGKAKAREAIKDEIDVCRSETKNHLKEIKSEISEEFEKMASMLVNQVQNEINNMKVCRKNVYIYTVYLENEGKNTESAQ